MLLMINANVYDLASANVTFFGIKFSSNPLSKISVETMLDILLANLAPQMPNTIEMITSKGIVISAANTLGITKYDFVLMPIISKASICSLTLMLPNSPAILLPITPANTIQTSVGANSRITVSLTT